MSDTTTDAERYGPEDAWPTPRQWVNKFLDADDDRRLKMAERVIAAAEVAFRCFTQAHEGELTHLRAERPANLHDDDDAGDALRERLGLRFSSVQFGSRHLVGPWEPLP